MSILDYCEVRPEGEQLIPFTWEWVIDGACATGTSAEFWINALLISGLVSFGVAFYNWGAAKRQQRLVSLHCWHISQDQVNWTGNIAEASAGFVALVYSNRRPSVSLLSNQTQGAALSIRVSKLIRKNYPDLKKLAASISDIDLYLSLNSRAFGKRSAFFFYKYAACLRAIKSHTDIVIAGFDGLGAPGNNDPDVLRHQLRDVMHRLKELTELWPEVQTRTKALEKFASFGKFPYTNFSRVWLGFPYRALVNALRFIFEYRPFAKQDFRMPVYYAAYKQKNDRVFDVIYQKKVYIDGEAEAFVPHQEKISRRVKSMFGISLFKKKKGQDHNATNSQPRIRTLADVSHEDIDFVFDVDEARALWHRKFWNSHEFPPVEMIKDRYDEWIHTFNEVRQEYSLPEIPIPKNSNEIPWGIHPLIDLKEVQHPLWTNTNHLKPRPLSNG
ncbi:hypothetical protein [Hyphococcus luteus]|uniref:hypothetical protein n=1 Tax=Hyphococcus luteus TaxID=2058213 RepID=UPI0010572E1D|nr:hypothetical protein [Marinicaulis flavus]